MRTKFSVRRFYEVLATLATAGIFLTWNAPRLKAQALAPAGPASSQEQKQMPPAKTQTFSPRDLSGTWMGDRIGGNTDPAEISFQPWAKARFDAFQKLGDGRAKMDPRRDCFPLGMPRDMYEPVPLEILQAPDQIVILLENDHIARHIFLDMPQHPKDISPSWMGHSIGKWDGDTLIVDTVALRPETFIDGAGHPHSDAMHLVERIKRVDANTLDDTLTVDDLKAYTKPWTIQKTYRRKPGWHVMEYVCEDEWTDKLKKYFPDADSK
jgi:hypothetical protein